MRFTLFAVCVTMVHALAIVLTVSRLTHRGLTKTVWWDDRVVVIPLVFDCLYLVTMWAEGERSRHRILSSPSLLTAFLQSLLLLIMWISRSGLKILYLPGKPQYIPNSGLIQRFASVLCRVSLMSLALSIVRMFPPSLWLWTHNRLFNSLCCKYSKVNIWLLQNFARVVEHTIVTVCPEAEGLHCWCILCYCL